MNFGRPDQKWGKCHCHFSVDRQPFASSDTFGSLFSCCFVPLLFLHLLSIRFENSQSGRKHVEKMLYAVLWNSCMRFWNYVRLNVVPLFLDHPIHVYNRERYHKELSSRLVKLKSKIFPIRNSNPQSSGLVTESSVSFKTRQFWSLLYSHFIFWVSFNLLTSPTSRKPGYPLPHNMLLFAIAVMEGVWVLDIIKKQGVASLVSAIDVPWDKWAITYLSLCASQLGKYPLVYLIDDFKLTECKSSWCDKLDQHYVCGYVHVSRVFTPWCYVIFKLL